MLKVTLKKTLLIAILIIGITGSSVQDSLMLTFDALTKQYNISSSEQIKSCFKQTTVEDRNRMMLDFFTLGKNAGSSQLMRLPDVIWKKISSYISLSTLNCFKNMNDLKQILRLSNTSLSTLSAQFSYHSKIDFLSIHYYFSNLTSILSSSQRESQIMVNGPDNKYSQIAKQLKKMALQIFNSNKLVVTDPWILSADSVEQMNEYFGISVSNGVIGAVSSRYPLSLSSTVLAGAYDKQGRGRVDNLIQTFSALNVQLSLNGQWSYYNYHQEVNMKESSMTHQFSSKTYSVMYKYYALKNLPFVFLTQFQISAHEDGQFVIKNVHEAPSHLSNVNKNFEQVDSNQVYQILQTEATTKSGRLQLAIASSFLNIEGKDVILLHEDWDLGLHLLKLKKQMKKGDVFKFGIVNSLMSSEHHEDPLNQAVRLAIRSVALGDSILKGHTQKWAALWLSDIVIDGNDEDQKFVRTLLYHSYSFISEGKNYGISPMGLSGLGYNGHVFWDMDLWIYPALLILQPDLAKNLIEYRVDRLSAARDNAFINGYRGAMYPWESSKSGAQQTPVWALTGPLQHHISGCVAFGVWNYYLVTKDVNWLREKGYQVLQEVAQFFESRVEKDSDGSYHIRNVVGADEWAENINDDAFTNGVAKKSLQIANKASQVLNYSTNAKWSQIADKISILKFPDNVTKEHETYQGQNIKQADVNLLSFPLKIVTQTSDVLRDLKFYESKIPDSGTPAMTYSIFTLLYSRLKDPVNSYKYFKESYSSYVKPPFNVFSQTKGGTNPYFMTGAGGVLQSMVYGFGGLDIQDSGIVKIATSIPNEWKKVTITASPVKQKNEIEQY